MNLTKCSRFIVNFLMVNVIAIAICQASEIGWWSETELEDTPSETRVNPETCDLGVYPGFRCKNGVCSLEHFRCDGDNDCFDGSDELGCFEKECGPDDMQCEESGLCVPPRFWCDGNDHCDDGTDEDSNICSKFYPKFVKTSTNVSFQLYTTNELVCELVQMPIGLNSTVYWMKNGQNISNPDEEWHVMTRLKWTLRLENVSLDDSGEYSCVAMNKMNISSLVFKVNIQIPEPIIVKKTEVSSGSVAYKMSKSSGTSIQLEKISGWVWKRDFKNRYRVPTSIYLLALSGIVWSMS